MNLSGRRLQRFRLISANAEIGTLERLFVDIEQWTIRYFSVACDDDPVRRVIVSPISVSKLDITEGTIYTSLSLAEVRRAPPADHEDSISRAEEQRLNAAFAYGAYWSGHGLWGNAETPSSLRTSRNVERIERSGKDGASPLVYSFDRLRNYLIVGGDSGVIGSLDDLLFDSKTWRIVYVIVTPDNATEGVRLLIDPRAHPARRSVIELPFPRESILDHRSIDT